MATVWEIQERISLEETGQTIARHALEEPYTETSPSDRPWPTRAERDARKPMNRPVRKVSYSAVSGLVTAGVLWVLTQYNIVLDPALSAAIVLVIMSLIGYVVPLSDRDLANLKVDNELG